MVINEEHNCCTPRSLAHVHLERKHKETTSAIEMEQQLTSINYNERKRTLNDLAHFRHSVNPQNESESEFKSTSSLVDGHGVKGQLRLTLGSG